MRKGRFTAVSFKRLRCGSLVLFFRPGRGRVLKCGMSLNSIETQVPSICNFLPEGSYRRPPSETLTTPDHLSQA
ncbi:MAG: hypothetical protein ACJAQ3_002274 [Planctomycetota bacterium]|jgi:hypothetical protein